MALGHVIIAGRRYEITGLRLRDGQLQITAYGRGPSPPVSDEPAAVFGEDGRGVCQSWHLSIPGFGKDQDVRVVLPIQIVHMDVAEGETQIIWE